jgi:UDP-glucose 4-epimerase
VRTTSNLSGARVLVTGGAGFIGSHVVERLASEDVQEILVFDNITRGRWANLETIASRGSVTPVEGDVRDRIAVSRVMDGIDVVIHLASVRLTQGIEDPRLALDVMVGGTLNVLEAAVKARRSRLVFASSSSVYGNAERLPVAESDAMTPNTVYATAKQCGEGLLATFRETHGLNFIALRPFNVYGPRMDTSGAYTEVLIRWMDRINRGRGPLVYGDGRQSMDLVYVDDVARAFVMAATSDAAGEIFNVATGVETTLDSLAGALLAAMDSGFVIEHGPALNRPNAARRVGDTARARVRLGFEARVTLEEGLNRLVRWWRQLERPVDASTASGAITEARPS